MAHGEPCSTSTSARARISTYGVTERILIEMIFEPVIRTPTAWSSVCAGLAIHVFEGHVSLAQMDQMQSIGERWTTQHPGKRVELSVIFPSNVRMTHEERTRMAKLIKSGEAHRTASATVILADGILASMQRSMLTGLLMIAPPPHPSKVFGTIAEAVAWIAPLARAVDGAALRVDALSAAIDSHIAEFRARVVV